ncbi:MAG: hypothetical protein NTY19_07810 [Planctomycetota bacterium]|nr:hypothetical protein [Planctomycetota bacterium]
MTTILRQFPFSNQVSTMQVGHETLRVRDHQIIVWVSITVWQSVEWDPQTPRFPAILDTGHTHNFSIQEQHLVRWAGMRPSLLQVLGQLREQDRRVPLYGANVWLHSNRPGERDSFNDEPPFRLELPRGVAIYPDTSANFPRLPLLGLRAIAENGLRLIIDGRNRRVSLRTTRSWWPFA